MAARSETGDVTRGVVNARWRDRVWRYGPVLLLVAIIFYGSTGSMAASNTSRIIGPVVRWLFPDITDASLLAVHMAVRKLGHFTVYAALALLAARAFLGSAKDFLARRWLASAFALVACVALADEFNQSFYDSRTGTVWDSLLDCAGGATALAALHLWRGLKWRRRPSGRTRPRGRADGLTKHEA